MKRIVILVSGRGSNMRAVVEACERERWPAHVAAVVSNRPDAEAVAWAGTRGLAVRVVDHRAFGDRASFDTALADAVDAYAPSLVVLAGFMRILGDAFVERYAGRLMNVHPSLLPAFAGLHTHRRALEAGCKLAGATVHLVTPTLDHGPIVAQAAVPVLPDDTERTLADRVLAREHVLLPLAVRWFVEDRLTFDPSGIVRHRDGAMQVLW